MHGFDACPSCAKLKPWLEENGIPFVYIDHPDQEERQRWYDAHLIKTEAWGVFGGIRSRTMPQLFIDGVCLGVGCETITQYKPEALRGLVDAPDPKT
jgi:glutaredoxin